MSRYDLRVHHVAQRHQNRPQLDNLEGRLLLTGQPAPSAPSVILMGLPPNEGNDLASLYDAYLTGANSNQLVTQYPTLTTNGTTVKVDVNGTGDFSAFLTSLRNIGMNVTASSATYKLAEGNVPISQLA